MPRKTKEEMYINNVFMNSRRCLKESQESLSPYSKKEISMKNPNTGLNEPVMEITHAINWCLKNHVKNWRTTTWRIMRSSYKFVLQLMVTNGRLKQEQVDKIYEVMLSVKGVSKKDTRVKYTASKRKKSISEDEYELIKSYLDSHGNDWGESLVLWLKAGMLTGLRPNEWVTALLTKEDEKYLLKTDNFKHNIDRSYDKDRVINITSFSQQDLLIVANQIEMAKKITEQGMYDQYYDGCRNLLYRLNKKLFPRRKKNLQLYTGRHQFSANAKADDSVSEKERAAMMGHKTTKTSEEGYGRKSSGTSGKSPEIANKAVLDKINQPENKFNPQKIKPV